MLSKEDQRRGRVGQRERNLVKQGRPEKRKGWLEGKESVRRGKECRSP